MDKFCKKMQILRRIMKHERIYLNNLNCKKVHSHYNIFSHVLWVKVRKDISIFVYTNGTRKKIRVWMTKQGRSMYCFPKNLKHTFLAA